jgi:uncharacterized protein YcbK (DUF882 family)
MGDLSEHFATSDFACPDCGRCKVSGALLAVLEELRTLGGDHPIAVLSGYRCPERNAAAGGAPASQHVEGNAADIRIAGKTLQEMYDLAIQIPAFHNGGVGVYDTRFIHVDVRGKAARWARCNGDYLGLAESGLVKV